MLPPGVTRRLVWLIPLGLLGNLAYSLLATDRQALAQNFESILDELDKSTRRDVGAVYSDAFRPFVALALILLGIELLLSLTRFRQFP